MTEALRTAAASEGDPDAAVTVDELSIVADSGVRILDRVSLEVRPGETLGVLGESGSGKSMTALAILGLLPAGVRGSPAAASGLPEPRWWARPTRPSSGCDPIRWAWCFQDPALALDPTMKIGRQITEVLWRTRG